MINAFKINIPNDELKKIYNKVKEFPWHEMPDDGGWDYGANLNYMKEKSEKFLRANLTDKPVNMKPGHFLKFMDKLAEFKQRVIKTNLFFLQ